VNILKVLFFNHDDAKNVINNYIYYENPDWFWCSPSLISSGHWGALSPRAKASRA
jgi:hypothetical protein